MRHFHVLLPRGTSPTKSGIRDFFRRTHIPPAGYQVGHTMVQLPASWLRPVCHRITRPSQMFVFSCVCHTGVPAGGGAPPSPDPPPPGGAAADRGAAASLQGRPGEEALPQREAGRQRHPGEAPINQPDVASRTPSNRLRPPFGIRVATD